MRRALSPSPAAIRACARMTVASSELSWPARSASASAARVLPAATDALDSTRLSFRSSQAGTCQPDRALATACAAMSSRPSASALYAAARPAIASISLSGLASRTVLSCVSRLRVCFSSWCSRCTQASAISAAGLACWAGGRRPLPAQAAVACSASIAARRNRPRRASASASWPRQAARSGSQPGVAAATTPASRTRTASSRWPDHSSTAPRADSTRAWIAGYRASLLVVAVSARASARVAACAAAVRFPLRRATARRIIAAASRAAIWWSAGSRSRMSSAASSPATANPTWPVDSATAAETRCGPGSGQASPCGMPASSSAGDGLPVGSMISLIASPSMTMSAASCQSPAWAACRTASVSRPLR